MAVVELELSTYVDMTLMGEIGIRGGVCHVIHLYMITKNKLVKNYDTNKESTYLMCWKGNNLHG